MLRISPIFQDPIFHLFIANPKIYRAYSLLRRHSEVIDHDNDLARMPDRHREARAPAAIAPYKSTPIPGLQSTPRAREEEASGRGEMRWTRGLRDGEESEAEQAPSVPSTPSDHV
ncbi:hypothetical protein GGF50DRAFT_121983 [Schizophyllum commune]